MSLGNGNPFEGDKGSNFDYELHVLRGLEKIANLLEQRPANFGLYAQTENGPVVTDTTVESSIVGAGVGSLSVPPNAFKAGDSFKAVLVGHISANNNNTIRIRVKRNGTTILGDTGVIILPGINDKHWELELYFTIRKLGPATVAEIVTGGQFTYSKTAGNAFEGSDFSSVNNTTFDTTVLNTLDITVEWGSASPGNSIYSEIFTLNKIF